ncbi:MAG TPA: lectin-like protein [Nannocystaceae bacterium]|nr:lectin-like protein [Nannocystaceae bacterium]
MGRRALTITMLANACGGGVVEASSIEGSSGGSSGASSMPATLDDTTDASIGSSTADTTVPATTGGTSTSTSADESSAGDSIGATTTSDDGTSSVGDGTTTEGCTPTAEICDTIDNDCDGIVDEGSTTNAVCGTCAFLLASDGVSYFALCAAGVDWDQARTACGGFGAGVDLAVIATAEDQALLVPFVLVDMWIGLHAVGEGDWDWIDGTNSIVDGVKVELDGWAPDQPEGGGMDCGEFDPDQDAWADAECDQLQAYICRHPA